MKKPKTKEKNKEGNAYLAMSIDYYDHHQSKNQQINENKKSLLKLKDVLQNNKNTSGTKPLK
jgi:hypothetical protein